MLLGFIVRMLLLLFLLMLFHGFFQLLFVKGGRLKWTASHPVGQSQLHGELCVLRIDFCSTLEGGNGLGSPGDNDLGPVRLDAQVDAGRCDGSEKVVAHGHQTEPIPG